MARPIVCGALRCGLLLFLGLTRLHADVYPLFDSSDISGQVVNFSILSAGVPLGIQFVGQGVSFDSNLVGATEADTATNSGNPIFVQFVGISHRVGFLFEPYEQFFITLNGWNSGNLLGAQSFSVPGDYAFIGIESPVGMDMLEIDFAGTFYMREFRFDLTPPGGGSGGGGGGTVPESFGAGWGAAAILGTILIWRGHAHCGWR